MIKIFTGVRTCGKSFLLFNIFKHYLVVNGVSNSHIITLAMDDRRNEVFETVYPRDIIERNGLKNAEGFKELVRVLASSMSSSLNPTRITNTFKSKCEIAISSNTILKYLDFLKDAFIINESLRYDVKGRKYIGTETKYYFEDVGIRNAIIDFRQIEYNHTMENVIYNELCKNGFTINIGMVETFRQSPDGRTVRNKLEIDFVVNRPTTSGCISNLHTLYMMMLKCNGNNFLCSS